MSILKRAMGAAAEPTAPSKIVNLGTCTIENKVNNVRGAQARFVRLLEEIKDARADLDSTQADLAAAINALDCGVRATVEALCDTLITEATR